MLLLDYQGENTWVLTLKKAGAKDAGYYTCTASNIVCSVSTEMVLSVHHDVVTRPDDDNIVVYDESVVSGDMSDSEFIEIMVTNPRILFNSSFY